MAKPFLDEIITKTKEPPKDSVSFLRYCELLLSGDYVGAGKELNRISKQEHENIASKWLKGKANLGYIASEAFRLYFEERFTKPELKIAYLVYTRLGPRGALEMETPESKIQYRLQPSLEGFPR